MVQACAPLPGIDLTLHVCLTVHQGVHGVELARPDSHERRHIADHDEVRVDGRAGACPQRAVGHHHVEDLAGDVQLVGLVDALGGRRVERRPHGSGPPARLPVAARVPRVRRREPEDLDDAGSDLRLPRHARPALLHRVDGADLTGADGQQRLDVRHIDQVGCRGRTLRGGQGAVVDPDMEHVAVDIEFVGLVDALGGEDPLVDHPSGLELLEAPSKEVGSDPREPVQQVRVPAGAEQQLAHEQQRPALTDGVQRRGEPLELPVAAFRHIPPS